MNITIEIIRSFIIELSFSFEDNTLYISFNFKEVILKVFISFSSFLFIIPFFFPFKYLAFAKNFEFECFNFSFSVFIK